MKAPQLLFILILIMPFEFVQGMQAKNVYRKSRTEKLRTLLKRYKKRKNQLFFACLCDDTPHFIQHLIEGKIHVNIRENENGSTPLLYACSRYDTSFEVIKYLIQNKADVNQTNLYKFTPLLRICSKYDLSFEIIKYLIDNNANVNTPDAIGDTPLLALCNKYNSLNVSYESIKYLIDHKADVNHTSHYGSIPLLNVCSKKNLNFQIIKYLIENNAHINSTNTSGSTPLALLCNNASITIEIIKYFIDNNADINHKNRYGSTALLNACKSPSFEIIKYLIENNADVNSTNQYEDTPLLFACNADNSSCETISCLIDSNAHVNIVDKENNTPLLLINCSINKDVLPITKKLLCAFIPQKEIFIFLCSVKVYKNKIKQIFPKPLIFIILSMVYIKHLQTYVDHENNDKITVLTCTKDLTRYTLIQFFNELCNLIEANNVIGIFTLLHTK